MCPLQHVTNLYQSHTCSPARLNLFHVNFFSALGVTYLMHNFKSSLSHLCATCESRHHLHIIIVIMNFFLCKLFVSGGKKYFFLLYLPSYFFFFLRISRNILSLSLLIYVCRCFYIFLIHYHWFK